MKNKLKIQVEKVLQSKILWSAVVATMLMSCGTYMGGYSETDGAYYDPNRDEIPQYVDNYGNRVGDYYNDSDYYDDDSEEQFGYDESIIAQSQYNEQQQKEKYSEWGNQQGESDWGYYTGTDTYYTNYNNWGMNYWGSPFYWGNSFYYPYYPYAYGWGYPSWGYYSGWRFGMSFGWGYPYWGWGSFGYGYPYYGGYYGAWSPYYYRPVYYYRPNTPRSKDVLLRNSNNGFRSQMSNVATRNSASRSRRANGFRGNNNYPNMSTRRSTVRNNGIRSNNGFRNSAPAQRTRTYQAPRPSQNWNPSPSMNSSRSSGFGGGGAVRSGGARSSGGGRR